jgi:flagellar basal-body rod modification protein FlgD
MLTATTSSTVSNTSATTLASGTTSSADSADMNAAQDRFLKLLVAQLNNQDPMNPMDNAQMTSQMAQINTVTGIQQVNDTLKSMAEQFTAMQVLQGSSMVGHDVLIEGNSLTAQDGIASGAIDLAAKAESVKVDIVTSGGQIVDTLNLGALDAGRHNFDWDASSYQGTGDVSFKVTATLGGQAIENTALTQAKVMSVGSENGSMNVQLQNRAAVAYSSVKAIL